MSALTVTTAVPVSSTPSRLNVEKPASVKVTVYAPGRRSGMEYRPLASVVVVRTFSIKAGLAASTVTPGSTRTRAVLNQPRQRRLRERDGRREHQACQHQDLNQSSHTAPFVSNHVA